LNQNYESLGAFQRIKEQSVKKREILWKDVCVTLNQHRALIHEKERRSIFRSLCMMSKARSQRGYNVQPSQGDCSHELLFWTLEFLSQKSADILFDLLTQTLRDNSTSKRLQRNLHNKTSKKVAWQWVQSELYMTVTHKMSNLHLQYPWWDAMTTKYFNSSHHLLHQLPTMGVRLAHILPKSIITWVFKSSWGAEDHPQIDHEKVLLTTTSTSQSLVSTSCRNVEDSLLMTTHLTRGIVIWKKSWHHTHQIHQGVIILANETRQSPSTIDMYSTRSARQSF
jgi:hypothetical protein